jgi:hypothetical protein
MSKLNQKLRLKPIRLRIIFRKAPGILNKILYRTRKYQGETRMRIRVI